MIERVLGHLAVARGRRGRPVAGLPARRLHGGLSRTARSAGIGLTYAVEPEPLDTAGAVRFAAAFAGIDETFVVVNGDVLTDLDLTAWWPSTASAAPRGRSPSTRWPTRPPSAWCPPTPTGGCTAFVEKPPRDEAPTNEINAGTYVLEPSVLERIPEGGRVSIERETFPAMVRDGGALRPLRRQLLARHRHPVGLPRGQLRLPRTRSAARSWPRASSTGATGCCSRARATWTGEVVGPVRHLRRLRGRAGRPGGAQHPRARARSCRPGALVADSVLMDGCHVAADAKVAGSVMGPRSIVGQRGDVRPVSVLGADAVVSSGTLVDGERVSG